ncbi:MAG: hypothetical protein AAGA88_04890 [Pseudomonadota bacterium]
MSVDDVLGRVIERILEHGETPLTAIGAGVLASAHTGYSHDTRSFARKLDVAHALVIRECVILADDLGVIALEDRNEKSQRLFFKLTEEGERLISKAMSREQV